MSNTFKKFNEGYGYVTDPFRQGKEVFKKQATIGDSTIMELSGYIDGRDDAHTAIISILTSSLDTFGEDLSKERFIIHQKDFDNEEIAINYIKEMESKIKFS